MFGCLDSIPSGDDWHVVSGSATNFSLSQADSLIQLEVSVWLFPTEVLCALHKSFKSSVLHTLI